MQSSYEELHFPAPFMILNTGATATITSNITIANLMKSNSAILGLPSRTTNGTLGSNGSIVSTEAFHQLAVAAAPAGIIDSSLLSATLAPTPEGCSNNINDSSIDGIFVSSAIDDWTLAYDLAEIIWGVILVAGIFIVNSWILWIIGHSRELWKPRHLWMACLCMTDLFVGAHKMLELILLVVPLDESLRFLCVIEKTTLGIPYVVNMLLLTFLSLDRFIAVGYPFFYSSSVSNKHVGIGFLVVVLTGLILASVSVAVGLGDTICRPHNLQLVYLTVVLTLCSILTLFFNSWVLRIAKKQLSAIYAHEPSLRARRVSVVCKNCGCKNETFVKTLIPLTAVPISSNQVKTPLEDSQSPSCTTTKLLPLNDTVVLGQLDNQTQLCMNLVDHVNLDCPHESHLMDETTTPLVRTVSLPTVMPDQNIMSVPISLVVQADASIPPAVVLGNVKAEIDGSCKLTSMIGLDNICPSTPQSMAAMPRSRSLVSCRTHKVIPPTAPRLQLFRNLHFARAHMFQVGRLFPSIRFARTVLLIMIPMWVFILPILTIIPLHKTCVNDESDKSFSQSSDFNCAVIERLWHYLLVHMRSVLPLQAILDTFIYACGSKEFHQALRRIWNRKKRSIRK